MIATNRLMLRQRQICVYNPRYISAQIHSTKPYNQTHYREHTHPECRPGKTDESQEIDT